MAKKALVTGGTGFVGGAIVRELIKAGEQVKVLLRPSSPRTNLQGLDVEVASGDLMQPESIASALHDCDRVYHCAALFTLFSGYERMLRDNVLGTRNVLQACTDAGIERVVFTSSTAACGAPRGEGSIDESQVWNFAPLRNAYIDSKFISEAEAMRFGARGLPVITVCPGGPIGPGDVRPTPTGQMVINLFKGRYPMLVKVPIAFVDVDDVARHHRLAMEKGKPGHRYLSVGETLTLQQLMTLAREHGAPWRPAVPRWMTTLGSWGSYLLPRWLDPLSGIARYTLHRFEYDTTKSRTELGMEFTPISESLRKAKDWFREQGKL